MPESAVPDILTPEEALKNNVPCICLVLDDDIVEGLQRVKGLFPLRTLISESLRPFINTFLPIAALQEQGKLTADCLPETLKGLESLIIKTDVAKARLDKKVKELGKQNRNGLGGKG